MRHLQTQLWLSRTELVLEFGEFRKGLPGSPLSTGLRLPRKALPMKCGPWRVYFSGPTWCCRAKQEASLLSPVSGRALESSRRAWPGPAAWAQALGAPLSPAPAGRGAACPLWFSGCPPHSWAQGSRVMRRRAESVRPFLFHGGVCELPPAELDSAVAGV